MCELVCVFFYKSDNLKVLDDLVGLPFNERTLTLSLTARNLPLLIDHLH